MAQIHPSAVISDKCELGRDVQVGPNCVIEAGTVIGEGTVLEANVVIGRNVRIGSNNRFYSNSTIGGQPQVLRLGDDEGGTLEIGDGNTFREQVTVHPSMYAGEATRIGDNNWLMIGVHIGHDCVLEDQIVMSNYCQMSGHCKVEQGVWLSGMVLVHQFTTVGKWAYAAAMAGINHDVPPFLIVSGHYPPRVRGVNKRGVRRAGLDEQSEEKIMAAYKRLYRSKGPLLENARDLAENDGLDKNVRDIVDAIMKSNQHRFGRYLETFRH